VVSDIDGHRSVCSSFAEEKHLTVPIVFFHEYFENHVCLGSQMSCMINLIISLLRRCGEKERKEKRERERERERETTERPPGFKSCSAPK